MLTLVSRIVVPALVTGLIAALVSTGNASPVTPMACDKITAKWSGVWIFMPDCPSPAARPPGASPPAQAPNPAPGKPPT
jgi:hypothetical protein